MSLFWFLALLFLALAFGVLVWTFTWVARLLARREREGQPLWEAPGEAPPETSHAPAGTPAEGARPEPAQAAAVQQRRATGTGVNATLGLVLSALACALFWTSPLVLVLSAAGVYFSGQALWIGLRALGLFIGRAAAGLGLGVVSALLFFAYRVGAFSGLLTP